MLKNAVFYAKLFDNYQMGISPPNLNNWVFVGEYLTLLADFAFYFLGFKQCFDWC